MSIAEISIDIIKIPEQTVQIYKKEQIIQGDNLNIMGTKNASLLKHMRTHNSIWQNPPSNLCIYCTEDIIKHIYVGAMIDSPGGNSPINPALNIRKIRLINTPS